MFEQFAFWLWLRREGASRDKLALWMHLRCSLARIYEAAAV